MKCQEVMELMQRQLDGDLDDGEMAVLNDHTRHCPDCTAMFERLKLLSEELTSLPKVTPKYSLVDAILPELERIDRLQQQDQTSETKGISGQKRRKRWTSWTAWGGAAAAALVAGIFVFTYPPQFGMDNANNSSYSADQNMASTAMDGAAYQMRATAGNGDAGGDASVGTESYNKNMANEESGGIEIQSEESGANGDTPRQELHVTSGGGNSVTGESTVLEDQFGSLVGPNGLPAEQEESPGAGLTGKTDSDSYNFAADTRLAESPDGKFIARIEQYSVSVVSREDGSSMIETSRKNGKHEKLEWSEDGTSLSYEVHVGQGAIEKYVIDTSSWKEKKAGH